MGYGFKDRSPKGMGRISVNLPTERRHIMQLEYNDHYVWSEVDDFDRLLRENSMGWRNFDFTAYAFEALHRDSLCVNTAMRQRIIQYHWFADWTKHLETHAYIRAGWQDGYAYQSFSSIFRLSWVKLPHVAVNNLHLFLQGLSVIFPLSEQKREEIQCKIPKHYMGKPL